MEEVDISPNMSVASINNMDTTQPIEGDEETHPNQDLDRSKKADRSRQLKAHIQRTENLATEEAEILQVEPDANLADIKRVWHLEGYLWGMTVKNSAIISN